MNNVPCYVCGKEVPDSGFFTKYYDIDVCGFECAMTLGGRAERERRRRDREKEESYHNEG